MTHKQAIISLWAGAVALIVISTGAAAISSGRADTKILADTNSLTPHIKLPLTDSQIQTQKVSRELVASIYDAPEILSESKVLGEQDPKPLKQEEIADISTVAVVRIFNKVEGTISYPDFDINLFNFKLVPNGKTYSESANTLATGTGFFIDDQGRILTNSHVADKNVVLDEFIFGVVDYYGQIMMSEIEHMDNKTLQDLQAKFMEKYGTNPQEAAVLFALDLSKQMYDYIQKTAIFDGKQNLTILDPNSSKDTEIKTQSDLIKLADQGLAVRLVDQVDDYAKTHKDVAILKIDSSSPTPFLTLSADKVSTGQQIYIVGFPHNAELDASDLFEKTMTQGTINSLKKLDGTELYQTDAKISPGSSGSPMLNEKGEVVGIISMVSVGEVGDNFGYGVPIENAKNLLSSNQIKAPDSNPYMTKFVEGLNLAAQSLCRKANQSFANAQEFNKAFSNASLQKYIDKCNETIKDGDSKDGLIFSITEKVKGTPLYIGAGILALALISLGAWFFIRRYRQHQEAAPAAFVQA